MTTVDTSGRQLLWESGRAYAVACVGLIGGLALSITVGWPQSTVSVPEAVLTGLCLGLAEATIFLNGYLWLGRTISASRCWGGTRIPRRTAGWVWAAYQGASLPFTIAQRRFQQGELGTLLALVVVTGPELILRAGHTGLAPIHPLLGIGVSIALGIFLVISPRAPWFHSLFAVFQNALIGLVHALVFVMNGSLPAVVTAAATIYLVLKRL